MIKVLKYKRGGENVYFSLEQYLEEYCKSAPQGWHNIINWIDKILTVNNKADFELILLEMHMDDLNIDNIKFKYNQLKTINYGFDDDILQFIAFLHGTSYFEKIGNPSIDEWLNSVDINHPSIQKTYQEYGYSFFDALKYELGQNAIRRDLLSTLHWVLSQGGN